MNTKKFGAQPKSLSSLLAGFGIHHEPSKIEGKHDLYNIFGNHIGTFDAREAFEFLEKLKDGEIE